MKFDTMQKLQAEAVDGPRAAAMDGPGAEAHPVGGWAKRSLDLSVALAALVMLLPLFIGVALLLRASGQGPVLFCHKRIGRNGQRFGCYKFRTMALDGEAVLNRHLATSEAAAREWRETKKLKSDPRVTPIGAILRKTSVDELPQLINVLRGEMSLVGPRPIVEDEVGRYGAHISAYLRARPGLTGAWQISGRNDVSYEERVRLDADYVQNWSFGRDLVIIVRTIPAVLRAQGSY